MTTIKKGSWSCVTVGITFIITPKNKLHNFIQFFIFFHFILLSSMHLSGWCSSSCSLLSLLFPGCVLLYGEYVYWYNLCSDIQVHISLGAHAVGTCIYGSDILSCICIPFSRMYSMRFCTLVIFSGTSHTMLSLSSSLSQPYSDIGSSISFCVATFHIKITHKLLFQWSLRASIEGIVWSSLSARCQTISRIHFSHIA